MKEITNEWIEENTIRCEASYRGGGIEIDISDITGVDGCRMVAYQNYLGGGLLGCIQNDYNFNVKELNEDKQKDVETVTEELNRYYHSLTNHEGDEWEETTYDECQNRPKSAY